MKGIMSFLARMWCASFHDSPTWPCNGVYHCRRCGREYRVGWFDRMQEQPERR